MSTNAQIAANQKNAQLSTGPITPEGKAIAARNSAKHGLTGQTLILSPEEREAYESHVQSYRDHHKPRTQHHIQLVQQLADAHWSIHQIFVHQSNHMSLMTAVTSQLTEAGADAVAISAALVPLVRTLNTLGTYEARRRRAAKAIQEEIDALEAELKNSKPLKTQPSPTIGSVCPTPVEPMSPTEFAAYLNDLETPFDLEAAVKRAVGTK